MQHLELIFFRINLLTLNTSSLTQAKNRCRYHKTFFFVIGVADKGARLLVLASLIFAGKARSRP
jgi:hypothetical protein